VNRTVKNSAVKRRVALLAVVLSAVVTVVVPVRTPAATAATAAPVINLGVDVEMYPEFGTHAANLAAAKRLFAYLRSLHANSVALCMYLYPIVAPGGSPVTTNSVGAGPATPSPSYLGQFIDLAHAAGLTVQVRPLLNEDLLGTVSSWRGGIHPSNPAQWFASYSAFLAPYFVTARQHHAEAFSIGAELTSMGPYDRYWLPLVTTAKRMTGAEVIFEANWNGRAIIPSATYGYDDYQPISGIATVADATTAAFTTGMEANLLSGAGGGGFPVAPADAQFSEVGISALAYSWDFPWVTSYDPTTQTVVRSVQANWFTAACNAVHDLHLRGIYFWSLGLNVNFDPTASADSANPSWAQPYGWQNTASSAAIQACFARLG